MTERLDRLFYPPGQVTHTFLDSRGDQIYVVIHEPKEKIHAVVVLAGPFGIERSASYIHLMRWLHYAAALGFAVLYFDYRGAGESSGSFASFTFSDWEKDAEEMAHHAKRLWPGKRIILQGLRFGALLASRLFARGLGDGLLLWEPPKSANAMLVEILKRKLAADLTCATNATPQSRGQLISVMEAGGTIEIEGTPWNPALWQGSTAFALAVPDERERRPWHVIRLGTSPQPNSLSRSANHSYAVIPKPPFWFKVTTMYPNLAPLFELSREVLEQHTKRA